MLYIHMIRFHGPRLPKLLMGRIIQTGITLTSNNTRARRVKNRYLLIHDQAVH